ncbi:ferredoxin [Faecalicatena acetigenes]|uniref:Ferredoxin n=1 Tax=Faecalicatena acetigenes TaxID=2981790 RepID=A0ABT2TDF8_9FIRM|nr:MULTISPECIES: ferredoxin [Lachnospiraceae]MCU6747836.1 ferredoxin [Faecalicatena acetigenes]SCI12394.1 Ferredoxin [uncultured Clostridium sp.]
MKAYVDENCIGCGLCASICPEVFEINEDQVAQAVGEICEATEDTVREARDNCPVDAIHTEE